METLLEYKCPACGGALQFSSDSQKMQCPYCDTELDVEALRELDQALENADQEQMQWQSDSAQWQEEEQESLREYVCHSCGGQILTDATTGATVCPYCDNPVVVAEQFSGCLRPDLVIPFKLDKEAAKAALSKHLSKKPLLPKLFRTENRIEAIQGVYVPFWLFDSDVKADIRYRATRVKMWSDSRYNYVRTYHYSVRRAGKIGFDAVPVDGSSKMENRLMESIEPYDLSQAEDFQTAYLAGFLADKYDVDTQQCSLRANDRIRNSTQQEFASTVIGYSSVVPVSTNLQLKNGRVRYALYPVWLLSTNYKGKPYRFAMNGQTGRFVGDLPVDWGKFFLWWAGLFATISGLTYLLGMLMGLI